VWIVDEKVPEEVVYRIARAAFHPLNQKTLQGAGADRAGVRLSKLPASFAIPVHPGAARYYAEAAKAAN
ncbi:MAG TPA: immunogenic protein, partial [Alphaproteobacteria bacterium]|nr:immunogenic protein [Alphaproteobacteria bacterium]